MFQGVFDFQEAFLLRSAAAAVLVAICGIGIAPAQESPMRIAFPSGMNGQIVVTMEKAQIAERNGLAAQFASFQYGPPMMEALAAGSIDAVVTSLMPVTTYAAKVPGDVKIVAMLGHSSHSLVVTKDSGVTTPEGLAGRKLGASFGSDSHLDALVWMKEQNLIDKVELVNVAPPELATALANRSVDAIVVRQPQVLRLQQQLDVRVIHTWPFRFVSIVKTKFIAARPDAFARYLDSLRDSLAYIAENHERTAAWFGEYLRVDPAIIKAVSKEDPNYTAAKRSDIDISLTGPARALIEKWAEDAYAHKMIRSRVYTSRLFQ
jgi:ABC-type nitrate/sulfonate/bicarbonate transport system substrate-binding protein